jgi:hypothetical protein
MVQILRELKPSAALEIGTYKGGSLQAIAHYSRRVISVDIDPSVGIQLGNRFPTVDFRAGDSKTLLPHLVEELNKGDGVDFVLIDGDHSTEGVRRDLECVLKLVPKRRMVVLVHDSFNPACREGMRTAPWEASPYVQEVELDLVPGSFIEDAYDTAAAATMWSGLAGAVLGPTPRSGGLQVKESQRAAFEAVKKVSVHAAPPQRSLVVRACRYARRKIFHAFNSSK